MRDYLSIGNLRKAFPLAVVITAMSIPRILHGGLPIGWYTVVALLAMTLVSGAATAWGEKGGMCGPFPDRRRTLVGLGIAAGLTIVITPIYSFWLDPVLYAALEAAGDAKMLELRYPETTWGSLALVLWSGSFQLMFFTAGGMSFFARLTGRAGIAVVLLVAFRTLVTLYQASEMGVTQCVPLFALTAAIGMTVSCMLFARTGLLPAIAFAMGMNAHLFL